MCMAVEGLAQQDMEFGCLTLACFEVALQSVHRLAQYTVLSFDHGDAVIVIVRPVRRVRRFTAARCSVLRRGVRRHLYQPAEPLGTLLAGGAHLAGLNPTPKRVGADAELLGGLTQREVHSAVWGAVSIHAAERIPHHVA